MRNFFPSFNQTDNRRRRAHIDIDIWKILKTGHFGMARIRDSMTWPTGRVRSLFGHLVGKTRCGFWCMLLGVNLDCYLVMGLVLRFSDMNRA